MKTQHIELITYTRNERLINSLCQEGELSKKYNSCALINMTTSMTIVFAKGLNISKQKKILIIQMQTI